MSAAAPPGLAQHPAPGLHERDRAFVLLTLWCWHSDDDVGRHISSTFRARIDATADADDFIAGIDAEQLAATRKANAAVRRERRLLSANRTAP